MQADLRLLILLLAAAGRLMAFMKRAPQSQAVFLQGALRDGMATRDWRAAFCAAAVQTRGQKRQRFSLYRRQTRVKKKLGHKALAGIIFSFSETSLTSQIFLTSSPFLACYPLFLQISWVRLLQISLARPLFSCLSSRKTLKEPMLLRIFLRVRTFCLSIPCWLSKRHLCFSSRL